MRKQRELAEFLELPRKIVLTTHTNPDGDAIGSSLAMWHYLRAKGHDVLAVAPNHFPGFLNWMPGSGEIAIYKTEAKRVQAALDEADLVFCLDYNALNRSGNMYDVLERCPAPRVLIDHHIEPELDSFTYHLSTTETSSTGELIYEFILMMGDREMLNRPIAECIYAGMVTDTGSFSFAANHPKTYEITGELVKLGVDAEKIHRLIYDTFSENRLRLLGHAISNRLIVWDKLHTALIYLTREDLKQFHYKVGDIEGVVNFPLMMENVNLSILLTERDNQIRVSMRSKGDFSVNDLARKHFNGGGHRNAAGGRMFIPIKETIDNFHEVLQDYVQALDYKIEYQ